MKTSKVFLGSDHGGFRHKAALKQFLNQKDIKFIDLGNVINDPNDDYPDFSKKVAEQVAKAKKAKGVLFCGSSLGSCITANKFKGVRAVSVRTVREAELARQHDDANIICLAGGDTVTKGQNIGLNVSEMKKIVNTFLTTDFSAKPRHKRRVDKIKKIE